MFFFDSLTDRFLVRKTNFNKNFLLEQINKNIAIVKKGNQAPHV